jgi:UDP-N-acetylglucosamine--N-acetylmuramyl-(pentapeptide) pyrophosphoryl-undecaprenol N-acetylglucosamine transferase
MTGARIQNPIVLAAGGTGGHVFPAQALAETLLARGHSLALITDRRGAEYGGALGRIDTYRISARRVGGGPVGVLLGILALGRGLIQARRLLKRLMPGAVIGFGGYPSLPTMAAATQGGFRTMIHEQNAVLGRVNRLLAPRVARIATSFAAVSGLRAADRQKIVQTGNPVRDAIAALRDIPYAPPDGDGPVRILITGGSQGATVMSEVPPTAAALLPERMRKRLDIVQQCRAEDLPAVRAKYAACGIKAELAVFFDDMPRRLGDAHLVIGRAGASTVAELAVVGRPSILAPYPHATDDHQTANARALGSLAASWPMDRDGFTAEALARRLEELIDAPETLARAARAARQAGQPDAAARLADAVSALAGELGDGQSSDMGQSSGRGAAP